MSDKIELLPCPFCGGIDIGHSYIEAHSCDSSYRVFGCISCGARFEAGDAQNWNRRAALAQQPAPALPEGWKLVPAEPTIDMLRSGVQRELADASHYGRLRDTYRAMLAALAAPVAVQEPVAWQFREIGEGEWQDCDKAWHDYCYRSPQHDTRPLYTAQPAAELVDTVAVSRQVLADMAQDAEDYGAQLLANRLRALLAGGAE